MYIFGFVNVLMTRRKSNKFTSGGVKKTVLKVFTNLNIETL